MKIFPILLLIASCSISSLASSASLTGANYGQNRTFIIAPYLSFKSPTPYRGSLVATTNYYRQLNAALVRKNPVLDAKRALASGRVERLSTFSRLIGTNGLENKLGNPFSNVNWQSLPEKLVQGSGFNGLKTLLSSDPQAERVIKVYAQSAVRYAYYWNRTVATHLRQQKKASNNNHINCKPAG